MLAVRCHPSGSLRWRLPYLPQLFQVACKIRRDLAEGACLHWSTIGRREDSLILSVQNVDLVMAIGAGQPGAEVLIEPLGVQGRLAELENRVVPNGHNLLLQRKLA